MQLKIIRQPFERAATQKNDNSRAPRSNGQRNKRATDENNEAKQLNNESCNSNCTLRDDNLHANKQTIFKFRRENFHRSPREIMHQLNFDNYDKI